MWVSELATIKYASCYYKHAEFNYRFAIYQNLLAIFLHYFYTRRRFFNWISHMIYFVWFYLIWNNGLCDMFFDIRTTNYMHYTFHIALKLFLASNFLLLLIENQPINLLSTSNSLASNAACLSLISSLL